MVGRDKRAGARGQQCVFWGGFGLRVRGWADAGVVAPDDDHIYHRHPPPPLFALPHLVADKLRQARRVRRKQPRVRVDVEGLGHGLCAPQIGALALQPRPPGDGPLRGQARHPVEVASEDELWVGFGFLVCGGGEAVCLFFKDGGDDVRAHVNTVTHPRVYPIETHTHTCVCVSHTHTHTHTHTHNKPASLYVCMDGWMDGWDGCIH